MNGPILKDRMERIKWLESEMRRSSVPSAVVDYLGRADADGMVDETSTLSRRYGVRDLRHVQIYSLRPLRFNEAAREGMEFVPLDPELTMPLHSIYDAKKWVELLVACDLDWHFDDCAIDCHHETNKNVSLEAAKTLNVQRDKLYDFDWGEYDCPIGYALHCIGHEMGDD